MFSSDRPDHQDPALNAPAEAAYDQLFGDVARAHGMQASFTDPLLMTEALKAWGLAHGLADLMASGRLKHLLGLKKAEREKVLSDFSGRRSGRGARPELGASAARLTSNLWNNAYHSVSRADACSAEGLDTGLLTRGRCWGRACWSASHQKVDVAASVVTAETTSRRCASPRAEEEVRDVRL